MSRRKGGVRGNLDLLQIDVTMDPENEEKVQRCEQAEAALMAEDDFATASDRTNQAG